MPNDVYPLPMTDWQKRTSRIEIGDRVCYKASFLRSTGQYSDDIPHARGIVKELKPLGDKILAVIEWDKPNIPEKVLITNLSKVTQRGVADE